MGMRQLAVRGRVLAVCFALCAALSACMTQLAAPFDSAIVASLDSSNQDIHRLFAEVGTGVDASTFASRKPLYDQIVGELGATELQITARPTPDPAAIRKAVAALQRAQVADVAVDPNFTAYPSARAVRGLKRVMLRMEAADARVGLRGAAVEAYENEANLFLQQAITYENYLKR
jgi:hypothetical protein